MSEQLPANVKAVRDAYVAKVPVPAGGPNPADDAFENRCRAWTKGLAQQIVFSTGDRSWGCKNAGGGRPQSKDAIAHQVGATLFGFDMLLGVGTGSPSLVPNPSGEDITGQVFMPVDPVDHINQGTPPVPPPPTDLGERVAALEAALKAAEANAADAQRVAAAAVTTAENALRQAQDLAGRLATLRARGAIDIPVVLEGLSRARAKGDVDLPLQG